MSWNWSGIAIFVAPFIMPAATVLAGQFVAKNLLSLVGVDFATLIAKSFTTYGVVLIPMSISIIFKWNDNYRQIYLGGN